MARTVECSLSALAARAPLAALAALACRPRRLTKLLNELSHPVNVEYGNAENNPPTHTQTNHHCESDYTHQCKSNCHFSL
jgi:hypothetical protein